MKKDAIKQPISSSGVTLQRLNGDGDSRVDHLFASQPNQHRRKSKRKNQPQDARSNVL